MWARYSLDVHRQSFETDNASTSKGCEVVTWSVLPFYLQITVGCEHAEHLLKWILSCSVYILSGGGFP